MAQEIVKVVLIVKAEDRNRALEYTRQRMSQWFVEALDRTSVANFQESFENGDLLWYGFGTFTPEQLGEDALNADHE